MILSTAICLKLKLKKKKAGLSYMKLYGENIKYILYQIVSFTDYKKEKSFKPFPPGLQPDAVLKTLFVYN